MAAKTHRTHQHEEDNALLRNIREMVTSEVTKRHESIEVTQHTTTHTHTHVPTGFDAYVTREMLRSYREGKERETRERIQVLPTDTKESLKRKRNEGVCEYFGCRVTEGVEWHHDLSPAARREKVGVYRNISNFRPTSNSNVLNAYENQLLYCTLLCKKHHEHTHTEHLLKKRRLRQQHQMQSRLALLEAVEPCGTCG